jgi:hypothetical protein
MVPLRFPVAVGVNVTATVQPEPDANVVGQLFVSAKSPLIWMLPRLNALVVEFVSVTLWAELEDSMGCAVNDTLVGLTVTVGEEPIPVRFKL